MTVLLAAEGLSVRLGGAPVLHDLRLEVSAGEVLGIFGPSGAGKSTLFRALAGDEPLASGRVLLAGEDVSRLPLWKRARRGLGYVPQTPSVLWDLTVAENLAVFHRLAPRPRIDPAVGHDGGAALLAALGLAGRADVRADALSGGERRRLELARALVAEPRVLLCDEPFAAIDPQGAEGAGALLRGVAARGGAVVLADHHVAEALRLCDRAALLLGGELVVVGAPHEFCRDPRVRKHYAALELPPSGSPRAGPRAGLAGG